MWIKKRNIPSIKKILVKINKINFLKKLKKTANNFINKTIKTSQLTLTKNQVNISILQDKNC